MRHSVLITGTSSGFGRAAVKLFLERGWQVAATMRDVADWQGDKASPNLLLTTLDVTNRASADAAFGKAVNTFSKIDCVVNNAGQGLLSVAESTPLEVAHRLFDTNFFGYLNVMQAALPHFRKSGGGRFINVSSGSSIMPEPLMSIYSASKSAVEGFSESVAYELATQNVVVKLVEPGMVQGTNFMQQTQKSSQLVPQPEEYKGYVEQIIKMYMSRPADGLATEQDVAEAIFEAATDSSQELRRQVGADVTKTATMRWESSEADYMAYAHSIFDAPAAANRGK